jgi:hypothetical protein
VEFLYVFSVGLFFFCFCFCFCFYFYFYFYFFVFVFVFLFFVVVVVAFHNSLLQIDLLYARLPMSTIPTKLDLLDAKILTSLDEKSILSLNGKY